MARRPRVVVPDIPHHVTQRGNNRQGVFRNDVDRRFYLKLLRESASEYGLRVWAYCLMSNHVHLVATPERPDSLARALGRTHSQYAQVSNLLAERSGHLWQNRFFSCPLDVGHFYAALRYVELNPVRAGLVEHAWEWPWSSARIHVQPAAADALVEAGWAQALGGWEYGRWRQELLTGPDERDELLRHATMTGEPLGGEEFVAELERAAGRRLHVLGRGRPRKIDDAPSLFS